MGYTSPEARAQMEELAARHRGKRWMHGEEVELLDSRFGARTIGVMTEIGPGMEVWTSGGDDSRRDHRGEAIGGYVLSVDPGWSKIDDETGEIVNHPARFRVYDPQAAWPYRSFQNLYEDEVHRPSVALVEEWRLVTAIRRFCREVGASKSRSLDAFDAQLVTDAFRLTVVIMGGR
jgi:hypothetical protein